MQVEIVQAETCVIECELRYSSSVQKIHLLGVMVFAIPELQTQEEGRGTDTSGALNLERNAKPAGELGYNSVGPEANSRNPQYQYHCKLKLSEEIL